MSWLLRLYPRRWRERYGDEFAALLEDVRPGPRATLDVLVSGLLAHLAQPPGENRLLAQRVGGIDMDQTFPPPPRQTAFAAAGLVLIVPTAAFLTLAVLKYWMGIDAPFDTVGPLFANPLIEPLTVAGPFLAFLVSTWPVVRLNIGWREGTLSGGLALRARPLNLVVSAVSAALIVVLLVYFLIENF
jgi:hypothetical protein